MRRTALLFAGVTVVLLGAAFGLSAYLYLSARRTVDEALAGRLRAVGATAAHLLAGRAAPDPALDAALAEVAREGQLDGAYVFDGAYLLVADAQGRAGRRANLMRLDPDRAQAALAGRPSVGWGFDVEGLRFLGGYFPVPGPGGPRALAIEAGEAFIAPSVRLGAAAAAAFAAELSLAALALLSLALAVRAARREQDERARAERAGLAGRMAAAVAHEVRNPLGIIRGGAELLRERAAAPRDRALLEDILGEVGRLNRLTEEFLDLAREQPLRPAPLDLPALLDELGQGLRRAYPALSLSVAAAAPPLVGDADKLKQALLNVLQNGAQATAGQGALRVAAAGASGGVQITVEDDGPGVAPEMAARLFEPFSTGRAGGTGLGLAIARRIVEQHGGRLWHSASARGARFEVFLPAAPAPGNPGSVAWPGS